jgi:hypothetical protein
LLSIVLANISLSIITILQRIPASELQFLTVILQSGTDARAFAEEDKRESSAVSTA